MDHDDNDNLARTTICKNDNNMQEVGGNNNAEDIFSSLSILQLSGLMVRSHW